MPVFNGEKYIRDALKSLFQQTYPLLEIIIVDDRSTDRTVNIVEKIQREHDSKIKLIQSVQNRGPSCARNMALKEAEGDWILFLDADDIAQARLLEQEVRALYQMNKGEGTPFLLVYPIYEQVDIEGNHLGYMKSKQVKSEEILGYEFLRNDVISPSGVLINREKILELNGFNEKIRYSEDWDLWLRLAKYSGFVYVDLPLVKIRRHDDNASSNLERMKQAELDILNQYPLKTIKEAIYKRHLSFERNSVDFVSMLFRLNRWDEGMRTIEQLKLKMECPNNVYFYEGLYYFHLKELDHAKESFEKLLSLEPGHGSALNNLGCIHLLNHNIEEAKLYFNRALKLYSGYVDAAHNLKLCTINQVFSQEEVRFTLRELRNTILRYKQ